MTPDPIGLASGVNLYAYVLNDPVNYWDSDGLAPKDKFYGLPKKFWQWYHRNIKEPGSPDINRKEAMEYYKEWKESGEPGTDNDMKIMLPPKTPEFPIRGPFIIFFPSIIEHLIKYKGNCPPNS